jgi:RND family efflux transporter MFP subunit
MRKKNLFFIWFLFTTSVYAANPVTTEPIQRTVLHHEYTVAADIVSLREVNIAMELTGKLKWVSEVGAIVQKGQLLATLNDYEYQLKVDGHNVYIEQLQSEISFAEKAFHRNEVLLKTKGISESKADDIKQSLFSLRFLLKRAEIDRRIFELELSRAKIRAPFSGQVVYRTKVEGSFVEPGDKVLTFVDIENKEISVKLPVKKGFRLGENSSEVTINLPDGSVSGIIKSIVQAGDELSRMIEVRIITEHNLPPVSTPLKVTFLINKNTQVWKVPRDAIIFESGNYYVYQVSKELKAIKSKIKVLDDSNTDHLLVEGDLNREFDVITRGSELVSDHSNVESISTKIQIKGVS